MSDTLALILGVVALVFGIIAVIEANGRNWAGWGVIVLAAIVILDHAKLLK